MSDGSQGLDSAHRAEAVATFRAVTAVSSDQEATTLLQACGWNLERAVDEFLSQTNAQRETITPSVVYSSARSPPHSLRHRSNAATSHASTRSDGHNMNQNGGVNHRVDQPVVAAPTASSGLPRWLILLLSPLRTAWIAFRRICNAFFLSLGGSARAIDAAPGDTPARRFLNFFESKHGPTHPTFFDGSYLEALADAQAQVKFLLVYLHSEEHGLTREFCDRVLTDTNFIRAVNEDFVFWAGSVTQPDGAVIQHALRVSGFPFLGVVAPPRSTVRVPTQSSRRSERVSSFMHINPQNYGVLLSSRVGGGTLATLGGRNTATSITSGAMQSGTAADGSRSETPGGATVSWLLAVHREKGGLLESVRREREQRDNARLLRLEQDREFARSLEEDRARERARELEEKLAREQAALIQERQSRIERKRAGMPTEPEKGPGVTSIVLRLPGGERANRRFGEDATLEQVFDWAEVNAVDIDRACLVSSYPRKTFCYPENMKMSLQEAGLFPSAMLLIEERLDVQ